jgi:hypothetical protein
MRSGNLYLAAYLHLMGIPIEVRQVKPDHNLLHFFWPRTERANKLCFGFYRRIANVPVRAFTESFEIVRAKMHQAFEKIQNNPAADQRGKP